jgi:HK97 family phage major capsid protein
VETRAFGILEVRGVDDVQRTFEGVANSDSEDSHGTVIEPAGAVFKLPIPLFFHDNGQHSHRFPIGEVVETGVRAGKRWFRAVVPTIDDGGTEGGRDVKRWVDAAWTQIKSGLVRGTSVEFIPIQPPTKHAKRWSKWHWKALAVVPLPSNLDATIQLVRSVATSGASDPGVPGIQPQATTRRSMTILEQIQQHENSRAAKVARQEALMARAAEAGTTLEATEAEEYDTLATEVEAIDGHLSRLNILKRSNESRAVAAPAAPTTPNGNGQRAATESRSGVPVVQVRANDEPGLAFARYVMAIAHCRGDMVRAEEHARRTWDGDQGEQVVQMLQSRAAVAAGTTTTSGWASQLVQTNFINEFLELLRPATLLGRIPGLRRVPFNISMPSQTAGGTYSWVGEGAAKPVTRPTYATVTLGMAKAAGIIVITKELARSSVPSAQAAVRDEMIAGMQQYLDNQFVDPAVAAVSNVSPASITNGVSATSASGDTTDDYRSDINALIGTFATANMPLNGVVLLMSEARAWAIGGLVNEVGAPAFPGLGVGGGSLRGVQIVASNAAALEDLIVAVHAPSVLLADDGGVEIDASEEASLQMDSAPDNPTTASTVLVSLWQRNLIALRAERFINWAKARTGAVAVLDYSAVS